MSLDRRSLLLSAGAAGLSAGMFSGAAPATALAWPGAKGADAKLTARFEHLADRLVSGSPELAANLGLDKGPRVKLKSRLGDRSWAAVEKQHQLCVKEKKALDAIPDAALSEAGRRHKAVIGYALELGAEGGRFAYGDNTLASAMAESATPYVVSQQGGSFGQVGEFLNSQHQIENAADAEAYLARLGQFPRVLDQESDRVQRDADQGVIAPDFILANAIGQIEAMLKTPPGKTGLVQSLATRTAAKGIAGDWEARATALVRERVYPKLWRQAEVLKQAAARADDRAGVWKLPDGEAYYSWLLKVGTSTALSAKEIHQMGLDQNAQIEARMDALLRKQGLSGGSVGDRMTALGRDKRFLFADTEAGRSELLAYLNDCIARVRTRLDRAFTLDLKAPVLVKRVPVDIQDGAGQGYMNTGSLDGSRPSIYYINLKSTLNWPKFSLPTLTFHETIPGHAWQGGYVTETGKLPLIRIILSGFNAYIEGWALYAEQLGEEMGMYEDDWAGQLGYLQAQKFRAVRLVVDTGLHDKRWTRDQAVEWAMANTGRSRDAMTSEIDRYCSTPGQACGYKVGHTEINRMRDGARARLGEAFDVRAFNDMVVEAGPSPLTVLEAQVERWNGRGA